MSGPPNQEPGERSNDEVDDAYRVAAENMREGQRRGGPRNQQGPDWRAQGYGPGYDAPFGSRSAGYGLPFGYGAQGQQFAVRLWLAGRPPTVCSNR